MRDALGGLVNIVIIVVFMVIVSGYLAFNVNYTKAFRVKNKIISAIETHEGLTEGDKGAVAEISAYEKAIGYNASIPSGYTGPSAAAGERWVAKNNLGFYYKVVQSNTPTKAGATGTEYYEIITFVTVDIPIIKKIMPYFPFFQVRGATKKINTYN